MPEVFAAAKVGDELVCRDCLTMEEAITAQRGFTDTLSNEDVTEKEYTCSRCNKKIEPVPTI